MISIGGEEDIRKEEKVISISGEEEDKIEPTEQSQNAKIIASIDIIKEYDNTTRSKCNALVILY